MLDADTLASLDHRAGHWGGHVRLVVESARQPCDQGLGNELTNEDDAAFVVSPHVEAQVQLGKAPEARPCNPENAGVQKVEGDQARERVTLAQIELQSPRQIGREQIWRHDERGQKHMAPTRRQERQRRTRRLGGGGHRKVRQGSWGGHGTTRT
jgi:hypothetical protein